MVAKACYLLLRASASAGTSVNVTSKMKYFSLVFLLGLLAAMLAMTSAVEDDNAEAHLRVRRGFGCPISDFCHKHCLSIGRRGGYCGGKWKLTCICYNK
ncbi:defensin-like [Rhipicephalus sanguineus]|uniref:defensin-like n=1 Tax=Rhipicephalus sanguineus TaxID=34632 RepID=UPI0020C4B398|nr:defensin-like [Rhipicephalus sanguineus]